MNDGTFNVVHVTEQLLRAPGIPWSAAPAALAEAYAKVDATERAHVDAVDAVSDAEMGIPAAQAQWDADAKAAVRAGKPLPSRDILDRARIAHEIAQEDERLARFAAQSAVGAVAVELSKPDVRQDWAAAIGDRLDEIGANLNATATSISPLVSEAVIGTSLLTYIGQWRHHPGLPSVGSTDPVSALHAIANMRRYTTTGAGNITA